ncbi:MAG: glycosyltransferase family 2 protein [Acetobacteraceae bacterium]
MGQPYFSVILATRNRPAEFGGAVNSVLAQSFRKLEIIVVNDGSDDEYQAQYATVLEAVTGVSVRVVSLQRHRSGHGQSYAINSAVAEANAPYICFLDDDDYWTDPCHLERAAAVISSSSADLYMANQAAYKADERLARPIWLEELGPILERSGRHPEGDGSYTVSVGDLLKAQGFCHLNTLIVRRTLYERIGGMEETIRWSCDQDFYLRLIDGSSVMKFMPIVVSRHNVPDPARRSSMTTGLTEVERRLFQLAVFHRVQYLARHPAIRAHARRQTAYTLKRIAEALAGDGRYVDAVSYGREALGAGPTLKWAGYTAWLSCCALLRANRAGISKDPGS